jgi:hypothetical protein
MRLDNRERQLLLCTLIAAPGPLVARRATAQEHHSTAPLAIVMPSVVTIPMLNGGRPGAPLPVVEATINGRGPYRFGIETGANFVAISGQLADSLHLTAISRSVINLFHVDSINVGGASFKDFTISALPRPAQGVDGLLGLPFYRNLLLSIDYSGQTIQFTKDSLPAADGQTVLPLSRAADFWSVPLTITGHPFQAILDTRSAGAISLSPETAVTLAWRGELMVIGRAGGAGIPTTEVKGGTLAGDVILGKHRLVDVFVIVHGLPPGFPQEPRLGAMALRNFTLSLDQAHQRVRLTRADTSAISLAQ